MFKVGDYIIYGNNGVCKVVDIGNIDSPGISKDRIYYTLCPLYTKGNKIFTPADNQKVKMRSVLTKEEATDLIDDIKNIDSLWILDEKKREMEYKEAFRKCDCRELVKIIKTIYMRKQMRLTEGKKLTAGDKKYFDMAEESLYSELAIPLEMNKDAVKEFVIARIK